MLINQLLKQSWPENYTTPIVSGQASSHLVPIPLSQAVLDGVKLIPILLLVFWLKDNNNPSLYSRALWEAYSWNLRRLYNTVDVFDHFLSLTYTIVVSLEISIPVILNSNAWVSLLAFHLKKVVSALDCFTKRSWAKRLYISYIYHIWTKYSTGT